MEIPYVECKDGEATQKMMTLEVRAGSITQSQKDALAKSAQLALKGCQSDKAVATLPDWWQTRIGADRPQAVVYFREWDGKKFGSYTHQVSIPHYSKPKTYKPQFPIMKKGDENGIMVLSDNSKIVVNCVSKNEAKKMLDFFKRLVSVTYAKKVFTKFGTYGEGGLKKVETKAVRLDFYSRGQEFAAPDWSVDLL